MIISEKYSIQEYEGKIKDIFINDIEQLNKIAIFVCICLYELDVFCVKRIIKIKDLTISVFYIFYDKDNTSSDKVVSTASDLLNTKIVLGPLDVDGYAGKDKIIIYIPVSFADAPFERKSLNNYIEFDAYADAYNDYLTKDDAVIILKDGIQLNALLYKRDYKEAIDKILDEVPPYAVKEKQSLSVNIGKCIQILKHELTHIFDNTSSRILNYYSSHNNDNYLDTNISDSDKKDISTAANLLYFLWCYTEFNAYTQTYSIDNHDKRSLLNPNVIKNISSDMLIQVKNYKVSSLDEYIETLNKDCSKLKDNNSESTWKIIQDTVIKGSYEESHKKRINAMSPMKFKKYFIDTTEKLINKFKKKAIRDAASQELYNRDINVLAKEIKNSCEKYIINPYNKSDLFTLPIKFNFYFKEDDHSYPVYIEFITAPISVKYRKDDDTISNNTKMIISIRQLKVNTSSKLTQFFNSIHNSYCNLYKEITSTQKASYLNKLYFDLADELTIILRHL